MHFYLPSGMLVIETISIIKADRIPVYPFPPSPYIPKGVARFTYPQLVGNAWSSIDNYDEIPSWDRCLASYKSRNLPKGIFVGPKVDVHNKMTYQCACSEYFDEDTLETDPSIYIGIADDYAHVWQLENINQCPDMQIVNYINVDCGHITGDNHQVSAETESLTLALKKSSLKECSQHCRKHSRICSQKTRGKS
jgi:hypothetical protein